MATRIQRTLLVALAALTASGPASAKVYFEWRPRATLFAGYNDNVPLDGSGGDFFGQARPGLRLYVFGEHHLRVDVDCQAGLGRLLHPEKFTIDSGAFASSGRCDASFRDRLSPRSSIRVDARALYAQDPFALSGMGLLLRAGQRQVFSSRLHTEVDHAASPRGQWTLGIDWSALAFGMNDPDNTMLFSPSVTYAYRTSPRERVEVTAREQLVYSMGATPQPRAPQGVAEGFISEGHAALIGYVRRLTSVATLTLRGGPLFVTGRLGSEVMPVARADIEAATPRAAARLTLAHDMSIGARVGSLVSDLAEVYLLGNLSDFSAHLRLGMYRNSDVRTQFSAPGFMGYGGEAGLDYRISREWTVGVAALREARLYDPGATRQVDRDVVQLRLTWERFRPF